MGNSLVEGKNIGKSLTSGFLMGAEDALIGGISGGLFGGFDALDKNTNFWSGTADFDAMVRILVQAVCHQIIK